MKNVAVITFHAALNYGSMLQAQATQIAIEKLGHKCCIINYRLPVIDHYDEIYCERSHQGWKGHILKKFYGFQKRKRQLRVERFEKYETEYLVETQKRFSSFDSLQEINDQFDVYVSGSDQIWSDQVPEIRLSEPQAIEAYFLSFTERKKVAYASCVATMKVDKLLKYKNNLDAYSFLSTREEQGADVLQKVVGRTIPVVLDPSLLLNKNDWSTFSGVERLVKEPYILLYSLRNAGVQRSWLQAIRKFNKDKHMRIVVIAPYFELPMPGIINMLSAGPKEFLNLYKNAEIVFTDTFHGTAFAVNFNRPVYSLENKYWKDDIRKTYLMNSLGMTERLIKDESDICGIKNYSFDYKAVNERLDKLRLLSMNFLKDSIG